MLQARTNVCCALLEPEFGVSGRVMLSMRLVQAKLRHMAADIEGYSQVVVHSINK